MKDKAFSVFGVLVDPLQRSQKGVEMIIERGGIVSIIQRPEITHPFILPGFIDSHVHVESSMLTPSRFAHAAVRHGTVGVVTDPHEVANVAGRDGVEFMIEDGKTVPVRFFFGAPSCVPASPLEVSGAVITASHIDEMLAREEFYYLSEMMNFPGVLHDDPEVWQKLKSAHHYSKPIDGHAPGLTGNDLRKYVGSGIVTDHECSNVNEALEKLSLGMKILIREGSAAKNFDNLMPLIASHPDRLMFCTDDCHPDYLLKGHINRLVARAIKQGFDLYDVIRIACINPVLHYKLPVGLPAVGQRADFILVEDLVSFRVTATYIGGDAVFENNQVGFSMKKASKPSYPFRKTFAADMLKVVANHGQMNVIRAIDGELITLWEKVACTKGVEVVAHPENDLLKIVLLDRYSESPPVVAFISGFGLKQGALACSIAHDSHHVIAVGCDDESLQSALQWIVQNRGGMCIAHKEMVEGIALPFYGLMTDKPCAQVADEYEKLGKKARSFGSVLGAPFMTLSFMALTVIPNLKINHNGLFDGVAFKNIDLFIT